MKRLIIDVDTGCDDALALILALTHADVEVVALTCVAGNTDVDNACANALRVLDLCNKPYIPVYRGAECGLLPRIKNHFYYGKDGLNDEDWPHPVDTSRVRTEHAVHALLELVNQNKGEFTLVALGPLTNIAMALKMDPEFGNKLKDVYVLGGSSDGSGNITERGEFNFAMDPESASICMNNMKRIIRLVPFDILRKCQMSWETYESFVALKTEKSAFLDKVYSIINRRLKLNGESFYVADLWAMAAVVDASAVLSVERVKADVELHGLLTLGEMVIFRDTGATGPNLELVKEFDQEILVKLITDMLKE